MPNLTASVPHQMTRAEASQRLREQVGSLKQHQGSFFSDIHEKWNGDRMDFSFRSAGQAISGYLVVDDQSVHVSVALPWMLSLLAGTYKPRLEQEIRHLLAGPRVAPAK